MSRGLRDRGREDDWSDYGSGSGVGGAGSHEGSKSSNTVHSVGTNPNMTPDGPRIDFDDAMAELSTLLPDERREEELLRPFKDTGEVHLKDVAFRTRTYRPMLDIWEQLHMDIDRDGVRMRSDMATRVRTPGFTSQDVVSAMHVYDHFRALISRLGNLLFPWVTPFYPDHMALHASFYTGGRGIVLTAGSNQAKYLLTTIQTFRKLGSELPVEIMYLGDDDLDEEWRDKLEALPDVITRNLGDMIQDAGWELKGRPNLSLMQDLAS